MPELIRTAEPEAAFNAQWDKFVTGNATSAEAALQYPFVQSYLPGSPEVELIALLRFARHGTTESVQVAFTDETATARAALENGADLDAAAQTLGLAWFNLHGPIALEPVHIGKPWGREIWHTGIEARGQASAASGDHTIPLPWLLSLCPRQLLAADSGDIILLKILDPLPTPVFGDLYFELHEEKREVYVVTHVDEHAWPGGVGGIRFGFNQALRQRYGSDEEFARAYLEAVRRYRDVRSAIDRRLDEKRQQAGIAMDAPLSAEQTQQWLQTLPQELLADEERLRCEMDAFTQVKDLRVGDVVKVPLRTPHSLLHGVRTIEFQTPVYERKILSFAQKVLTQNHWDTEAALALAELETPPLPELRVLHDDGRVKCEAVVRFEDFHVERLTMNAGAEYDLDNDGRYALLIAVSGALAVGDLPLAPEQSAFLSRLAPRQRLRNPGGGPATVLLARPSEAG